LRGPGVGDDSLGLATLLSLCRLLPEEQPGNLILVATTSTEGQGNLRGSRYFVKNCRDPLGFVVCLEGHGLGRIDHWSLGTLRLHIEAQSKGGHVWRDRTGENPIEVMSDIISKLKDVKKSVAGEKDFGIINPGRIKGGRAFNTVPYGCELDLEIRSDATETLNELCEKVFAIVKEIDNETTVKLRIREVSRRPVSGIEPDHWLVETVSELHKQLAIDSRLGPASSDGCIFLDSGIPTITLGLARGSNRHRKSESIAIDSLNAGQLQTVLSIIAARRRLIKIKNEN
ncbi:MAG: M20/M25/M40 family metallo-hydrolase, partial [bacterium]